MAGLGRTIDIFNDDVMARLRPTIYGAMDAVVTIYDPALKTNLNINWTTGGMTVTPGTAIATASPARIMPVRGANLREGDPIQRVRVSVPIENLTGEPRPGLVVVITSADLYPELVNARLTIVEVTQSSAPLTATFEAMYNTQISKG